MSEIHRTVLSIKKNKAPGSDGILLQEDWPTYCPYCGVSHIIPSFVQ